MMFKRLKEVDMDILNSTEVCKLERLYEEKFGERFIGFNYRNFKCDGEKCAAQVYKETLEKALQDDKPSTLKYQPSIIELENIRLAEREDEIERAMASGEPIQLTALELLSVERDELQKIHKERYGVKMKFGNICRTQTVQVKHIGFDFFVREMLLEVLRQGKPYEANPLEEAKAWEQALLDRLVREGKWPPQVPDGMVWDHEKIVKRLMEELGE